MVHIFHSAPWKEKNHFGRHFDHVLLVSIKFLLNFNPDTSFSSQLSHLSDSLNQIIRIDPFSLLPRETSLRILGYLDAFSLGRAAQVSRSWKALADDDLLWRRMCGQHIDRKCDKCGWGLPLLERKRLRVELKDRSPAGLVEHDHKHENENGQSRLVTRDQVLSSNTNTVSSIVGLKSCDTPAMYLFPPNVSAGTSKGIKRAGPESSTSAAKKVKVNGSDSEAEIIKPSNASLTREVRLTRPWKTVYCERLMVERNWRKGRCSTKVLKVSRHYQIVCHCMLIKYRVIPMVSCVFSITLPSQTRLILFSLLVLTTELFACGILIRAKKFASFEVILVLSERFNLIRCSSSQVLWTVQSVCGIGGPVSV